MRDLSFSFVSTLHQRACVSTLGSFVIIMTWFFSLIPWFWPFRSRWNNMLYLYFQIPNFPKLYWLIYRWQDRPARYYYYCIILFLILCNPILTHHVSLIKLKSFYYCNACDKRLDNELFVKIYWLVACLSYSSVCYLLSVWNRLFSFLFLILCSFLHVLYLDAVVSTSGWLLPPSHNDTDRLKILFPISRGLRQLDFCLLPFGTKGTIARQKYNCIAAEQTQ